MGNSKKVILISIIVVVALLVITGGVFAYTYFFTDAFKTEQQLFYKYIAKNSEIIEFLEDKKINEYNEKLKISPYNNNGEASIAISGNNDESAKAQTEELKKYKLTYDGGVNKNNQYSHENLKLLYNENELLGGTLIHKNDYYGINVSVAPQKYIVLENNNLKQFAKNMGMSEEQVAVIPDKINFEDIKNQFFTKEEIKEILNRYLKVIADNLNADLFSKNKTDDGYVYTLTIDERTYKTVVNALIDTLKNDDQLLNKIKEIYVSQGNTSEEETQQLINILKENLEDSKSDVSNIEDTPDDEKIYINVYSSKHKLDKTEIIAGDEGKAVLTNGNNAASFEVQYADPSEENTYKTVIAANVEKTKTDNDLSYKFNITAGENEQVLSATINYTGISNLDNVQTNLLIDFNLDFLPSYMVYKEAQMLQNAKVTLNNEEEKEEINIALLELITKMKQDTYTQNTEFEINETTIKQQLDSKGISAVVSQNGDGTFKIVSNSTGNTYTVNAQGQLINIENATNTNQSATSENEENSIIISLNIKNTNTFGEVQEKELNDDNMYKVNDKSLAQLQNLFTQIFQMISKNITSAYTNTTNTNNEQNQNNNNSSSESQNNNNTNTTNTTNTTNPSINVDLSEREKETFNAKFTPFEGDSVSGSQVNTLIQATISSNQGEISNNSNRYVKIAFPVEDGSNQEISVENGQIKYSNQSKTTRVTPGYKYKVTMEYTDGVISSINVQKNN